ncbi:MAG: hypothetical protein GF364_21915 [Candidatus Lokiarchaeota archaeon]|nr:hypothetical protein [Candidatus Lokiarchaeota archaeon]
MTVYFNLFLHIYQPPVQIPSVIEQIVMESYRPILYALKEHPNAKITLNINGSLTEQLHDYKYDDVIELISRLANNGQIEFTGSAKYHPLLPLIPAPEIKRQIELNNQTNEYFFGKIYQPKGFFPPEMAVSEEVFDPIKDAGFEWIIMSGIANSLPEWPTTFVSQHPNGLKLLFRDDLISIDTAFDKMSNVDAFANRLKYKNQDHDYYVIIALDGETFGHHIKHAVDSFLTPLFQAAPHRDDIKMCSISEIMERFPIANTQKIKASSWSTMSYDIQQGNPFPLWLDPHNTLHKDQYKFMMYGLTTVHLAYKYYNSMNDDQKGMYNNARNFLDRGLHSCQEWWASKRPWYSPDMILRGVNEILLAVINAKRSIPKNAVEILDAMNLILKAMLETHTNIVLSLD